MSKRHQQAARVVGRTVVVVDDDPRVRQSLQSLLSSAGINVRTFSSGSEVLNSGVLDAAGCLITDVRMPAIDGWELQRLTTAAHPLLPLIFVTAHQDEEAFQCALSCGAFAFLYKPFDGEELLRTVQAAIKSNEIGDEDLRGL
jgi:FixJ family two-component response regulator